MFGKSKKIKELEEKIEEISNILRISWTVEHSHQGSPPHVFYQKYSANQSDILKALLDYLGLGVEIKEPDKDVVVSIKKLKNK